MAESHGGGPHLGAPLSERVRFVRDLLEETRPDRMATLKRSRDGGRIAEGLRLYHAGEENEQRKSRARAAQIRNRRQPFLDEYGIKRHWYGKVVAVLNAVEFDKDRYGDLIEWVDAGRVQAADDERIRRQRAPRGPNDPHTKVGTAVEQIRMAVDVLESVDKSRLERRLWEYDWQPELRRLRKRISDMTPREQHRRKGDKG